MKKLILIFLLSCIAVVAGAQDSLYVRRLVGDLASKEMFGRGMQRRGDSIAAEYLRAELRRLGVEPLGDRYYQYFRFPRTRTTPPIVEAGYRSQNVCGRIRGEVDTMVVLTAHYEHLGMNGDTIFYGAHDNASGTAAVMDVARRLMESGERPYYTYVFLFFGGEEAGLVGSSFFADVPLVNLSKVKLLLNIDLFCGGEEGMMVVNANDERTSGMVDKLERINAERGLVAKVGRRDNAPNSDHYAFTSLCPAIFVYTLGGPYGGYHSPEDTCEGCGLDYYVRLATLLRVFLEQI